ncbi:hypothetical protein [Arthrobacter subterraneus]|uniref:hypothetical protein n=1 Tax=Arthrobacter subterraneus TaxID=335973 RepID=UPI001113EA93|nr:hypothetical protein [Arthrobacter subterraneus]
MSTQEKDIWRTDPVTLRDVVLDREAMERRLMQCPALERIWIFCLLDRTVNGNLEMTGGGRLVCPLAAGD